MKEVEKLNNKGVFSEDEKRFIIENYYEMSTQEMSNIIGKKPRQIQGYANGRNLVKNNGNVPHSKDVTDYILKWYNIKSNKEIAEYTGLKTKQVNDYGYRHVGKLDGFHVDDTFFEIINTEEKAYWLGFLYADGCVLDYRSKPESNCKALELALCEKDKMHIEKLHEALGSNYKTTTGYTNGYAYCKTTISNTKLCDDLINLKCVPRKSLILEFPNENIVPTYLVKHFIRGYFDGDGCVSHQSEKATYKGYIYGFVGTLDIINNIQEILNVEIGATKTALQPCGKAFQAQWGGRNNCKKFYEYIYKDATIYLDRKYRKFLKIINKEV